MAQTTPEFDGRLDEMYAIFLENLLFIILTLGFYRFWAKTRVRRYLIGHMRVMDDRMEYTGTGWELFKGFLLVLFGFYLPALALFGWLQLTQAPEVSLAFAALITTALVVLTPFAQFTGMRYRMTRTQWRGVRCGLVGSPWGFVGKTLLASVIALAVIALVVGLILGLALGLGAIGLEQTITVMIVPIPLDSLILLGVGGVIALVVYGVLSPILTIYTERYRLNRATFGDLQAGFDAHWREVPCLSLVIALPVGLILYLAIAAVTAALVAASGLSDAIMQMLLPLILGGADGLGQVMALPPSQLIGLAAYALLATMFGLFVLIISFYGPVAWHMGRFLRFIARRWRFGDENGPGFAPPPHPWAYVKLFVGNLLIRVFTLGLGTPLIWHRTMRFLTRVAIVNAAALEDAAQSDQTRPTSGEGLLGALDVGVV